MTSEEQFKVLQELQEVQSGSPGCDCTDSHKWDNKIEIQHLLSGKTDLEINQSQQEIAYYDQIIAFYNQGEYEKAWEHAKKGKSLGYQIPKIILKALRKASRKDK